MDKFDELQAAFKEGHLIRATRRELEHYAMTVCSSSAPNRIQGSQLSQLAETVRFLLLVKISEETQTQAMTLATIALIVSVVAAVFTGIQALVALGIIRLYQ